MDGHIYNAAILCNDCAAKIRTELENENQPDTGDSGDYPQGPYSDGGGEADCPHHCDACGLFLENPLTEDGADYVRDALQDGSGNPAVLSEWRDFYDYLKAE
tara:strand:+ start:480 stop:785 length:306 start_codon:yes stop_codon:yes gene_type:complete